MVFIAKKGLPCGEFVYLINAKNINDAIDSIRDYRRNQHLSVLDEYKSVNEANQAAVISFDFVGNVRGFAVKYEIKPMLFEDDEKIIFAGGFEG